MWAWAVAAGWHLAGGSHGPWLGQSIWVGLVNRQRSSAWWQVMRHTPVWHAVVLFATSWLALFYEPAFFCIHFLQMFE